MLLLVALAGVDTVWQLYLVQTGHGVAAATSLHEAATAVPDSPGVVFGYGISTCAASMRGWPGSISVWAPTSTTTAKGG